MSSEHLLHSTQQLIKGTVDDYGICISEQSLELRRKEAGLYSCYTRPEQPRTHIPFRNIIWCSRHDDDVIEVTYTVPSGSTVIIAKELVELTSWAGNKDPSQTLIEKAYAGSIVSPSILVVLNNHGGRGDAYKIYKLKILPMLEAAHVKITYQETEYVRHGEHIGQELNVDDFDIVACCSGDGIPHEIINGIFRREDRAEAFEKVAITQLPCGSGNALSLSTHGSNDAGLAAFQMLKLQRSKMDLMAITQKKTTKVSFLLQAYGVIADSDIGTEHLRWMGPIRFEWGVFQKVVTKAAYPCDLWVQYAASTKKDIVKHYQKYLEGGLVPSATPSSPFQLKAPPLDQNPPSDWQHLDTQDLNILYVGNMPYMLSDTQFFPAALPNDGAMDLVVTSTRTPFFTMANILFSVDKGGHIHLPEVHHAKIVAYRLVPKVDPENHYISVDGESFPLEPLQVEVMPGVLTVLLQNGAFVDTCFSTA